MLARGAALRFLLTRYVDWLNVPAGALVRPKDPREYLAKLRFHQSAADARVYGVGVMTLGVEIWTDGACSGNPGPGGWGAILRFGDREREINGGEPLTTNNRMELTAAIMALETLTRPCAVDLHTDSQYLRGGDHVMDRRLEGARLAHRRPKACEKRRSVAKAGSRGGTA